MDTQRLILKEFSLEDAEFIYQLLNTEAFKQHIGDKGIKSLEDAENYILTGPVASFEQYGYGAWLVVLKECETPIGLCGYFKRDYLDYPDIGYAFLPKYWRQGFAIEAAQACKGYAKSVLALDQIYGICGQDNHASIKLLEKLGMHFKEERIEGDESIAIYELIFSSE